MDLSHLQRDLAQAQEVKLTLEGKLVDMDSDSAGTYVKSNTWA